MIDPKYMRCIQIVVTNKCNKNCCHCSQVCPHIPKDKLYEMSLEQFEKALQSLEGFPGEVGIFGGEPTICKDFEGYCKLLQKYFPVRCQHGLWTNGFKYDKYRDLIQETFPKEQVAYNEHEEVQPCWHQPNQIAISEVFDGHITAKGKITGSDVISDFSLMNKIIDNCWVNLRWSAVINPRGVYFCEVAAAKAILYDGPKGLPVEKDWWKRPIKDYRYLIDTICPTCSMCLPMPMKANDKQKYDNVSKLLGRELILKDSPKAWRNETKIIDMKPLRDFLKGHKFEPETDYLKRGGFKDFPDWTPYRYRPFGEKKHAPSDIKRK